MQLNGFQETLRSRTSLRYHITYVPALSDDCKGERDHYVLTDQQIANTDNVEFRDEEFFEAISDESHKDYPALV